MPLTDREKATALVASGITAFSLLRERGELPPDTTLHGFVLGVVPGELAGLVDAALIDEVFGLVASSHGS